MRGSSPQLYPQLLCFFALILLPGSIHGQIQGSVNSRQDIQNRELALRHIRDELKGPTQPNKPSQIDLRADFRQLQIVNNALMKGMFSAESSLAPKEARYLLGQIKKLAGRLKTSLALPDSSGQTDKAGDAERKLFSGLLKLDQTVSRFVENPLFQKPTVLNITFAVQAENDLNEIIRLTDSLSKLTKLPANKP